MLAPDSRALLIDALRPPPGHDLDRAVATTFTLDLMTALTVPLALAGHRLDDQPDPVGIMDALRRMSGRLDIFCQAGAIGAGKWPSDLVALVEDVIHEVQRPRPGHIFHPKVWLLRFTDRSQEPSFRLLVLSRNLTADRSWDTILWLDGRPAGRPRASNRPLAQFIAALPDLAVRPVEPERREALSELAEELRRVDWDLPSGAQEASFHHIGLPTSPAFRVDEHFNGDRVLAISPFVRPGALRRLLRPETGRTAVLVSRGEELDALPPTALEGLEAHVLDPIASLSWDDAEEDTSRAFLTRLHAKLYVVERGRQAHLFVGSANATDAGLGENVEFLCELTGPVGTFGVEALVGEDAPFRAMLIPYVASESHDEDEGGEVERELDELLVDIAAGVAFHTSVARGADGWAPRITADAVLPRVPRGTRIAVAPHNRPGETHPLSPDLPIDVELPPRDLADVTPFLRLTAGRTVEGEEVERSTVICSRLTGAPSDRLEEVLARQIDTPEKFLRLLALLIGFASRSGADVLAAGDGSGSWSPGDGQGVLELLARALSENPESIDHLEGIVERLRRSESERPVLPSRWDEVWLPALEARRAMRGDAS